LRLTKLGGSEFWAQLVITVAPRSDSAISGTPVDRGGRSGECLLRIAVNDISNRKNAEAEKSLLEIKLRESQKLDAVGRLTGGIAHDFNNILQVICGYTKMVLRNQSLDQRAKNDLQRVDDSAQRAADLVKRLIGFARQNTLHLEAFPIKQAIEQLLELIRRVTEERIVLEVDSCPGDPHILADRGLFEQVLMNLCINARDSVPGYGKIVIRTRMLCESDNLDEKPDGCDAENFVVMTVADTGCGMDDETRIRCIDPFFSTKGSQGHSGLGLAMVHGILRQHKGWMQIQSASGEGSQFRLYWPATESMGSKPVLPEQEDTFNGTETILLAEDDEAVREMTATVLAEAGYSVFKAENGAEAVALFRQHRETIHMLLFDMVMPVQGGFEAYREIEALSPGIKVLFVTGHQENLDNANTLLRQGLPVASKPLMPDDLLHKLRIVLDSTRNTST
jgi:signal transduction histidine kinase/ActR/RegA family two-component response regulator